jgi:PAS domain S-box-containing protein
MRSILNYLDPFSNLGIKEYKIKFSTLTTLAICILSEFYANILVKDPLIVGKYIIFVNLAEVIYFAFRNGIFAGLTVTFITVLYYLYIIVTRNYTDQMLTSGLYSTFLLGIIYASLAIIIGYLKQKIDFLIDKEFKEKRWLQRIIDQMPVGVVIADKDGKIIQQNKQVEELIPLKQSTNLIVGKSTLSSATFPNGKPVPPNKWPMAQAFITGKPVSKKEFILNIKEDKNIYIQISSHLIRNKSGEITAGVSIINDITATKEHERRKDDFVNMASHEIKTPLTSIKLYLELLKRALNNSDYEKTNEILISMISKRRNYRNWQ